KPSNLFITADRDGAPRLKVMDFGIAKVLEDEAVRTATHIGTPAYNAPEQMGSTTRKLAAKQGIVIASGVSAATDVWALGLIVYEMFTGDVSGRYWGVETLSELPLKVAFEELAPPSTRAGANAPLLPTGFDEWFAKCMRKNAIERWPSVGEAVSELVALLDGDIEEVNEDELEQVATRLATSPVPAADQKKTRLKKASEPPESSPSSKDGPPSLPRISSPAITVAAAPSDPKLSQADQKVAVSSDTPVVKTGGRQRKAGAGGSRMGLLFAAAVLAVGAGAAAVYQSKGQAGNVEACTKDGSDEACRAACDAGSETSCAIVADRAMAKGDYEGAFEALQRACGVTAPTDTAALSKWTRTVESEGCAEGACAASACVTLASFHTKGLGGALQSPRAATSLFKRTCRVGMDDKPRGSEGCVGLGSQREKAGEILAARNYFAAACEDGLADGCVALGHILERGNGEWQDEKRARELYQKACDAGELRGCTLLGSMVERGRGGWVKDDKAAVALYQRACDGGQQLGCVHLADAYLTGRGGVTKDAVRAVELLTAACDSGEMAACADLSELVLAGQGGLSKDEKRAFGLQKKACEGGNLAGCGLLAEMYAEGRAGLTRDAAEARSLADRACKGGEARACLMLARLEAAAGDKTPEELRALYDKACEAGEQEACQSLAELLEQGDDAEKGRAVALYEAACEAGQLRACTNLANLVYVGAGGLERDAERCAALNQKACNGGDAVGCARVGILRALGQGLEKDLDQAREAHEKYCAGDVEQAAQRSCETLARLTADEDAEDGG
ncbi:MAG TPA: hypothetical protein ENK57_25345, partial [Polyangiaceae bacterium]|nr:hypothetical protein [Polyangiaceae bacterium]